jgi:hypothetical protein
MHFLLLSSVLATAVTGAAIPDDPSTFDYEEQSALWQPAVGTNYQMILSGIVDPSVGTVAPSNVPIYDIDLFYTNKSTIDALHSQGKKVICYFSAGSSEDWRPDYNDFPASSKGPCLDGWAGERWLDTRDAGVFEVMKKRIALASQKGCDAIDPDNVDGYDNGSNFGLTQQDGVNYIKKLANEARSYGMSIGLKNAQSILPMVLDVIQFAVNEVRLSPLIFFPSKTVVARR